MHAKHSYHLRVFHFNFISVVAKYLVTVNLIMNTRSNIENVMCGFFIYMTVGKAVDSLIGVLLIHFAVFTFQGN